MCNRKEVIQMSVILFNKNEIYQDMADAYESLKEFMRAMGYRSFSQDDDTKFSKALRRLYFANVASFLCQYHDDTPEKGDISQLIDPFVDVQGHSLPELSPAELIWSFTKDLQSLEYNLCTNDGGVFVEQASLEYIKDLAFSYMATWFESYSSYNNSELSST
jgi:hypothetical protein